jgi:stage III sporulation protein AE
MLIDALGVGLDGAAPTLAVVLGIVVLSAILTSLASSSGGLSRTVEGCIRLCTFTAISGVAVRSAESLSLYFERLFSAVAGFLPLSAALYAMGGNLTVAAGTSATLGITLSVVQFFCTKTVIPVFCISLCSSMLSVFEGQGGSAAGTVSGMIRKWYTTSLAFVMMILTCSLGGSTLLASKADNMAMRGAKFAASSFIPVSGGTVSSTLGTLAASVELLRGSVGVIGIVIIIMMLLPTVIELALLRGVFLIGSFCASTLGAQGEAKLLSELDSLYGYLEGIAALSAVVFIIAFGIFATTATPFS